MSSTFPYVGQAFLLNLHTSMLLGWDSPANIFSRLVKGLLVSSSASYIEHVQRFACPCIR